MRCANWRRLPLDLARKARERSASKCVDSTVQCQLCAHEDSQHYGLLDDLEYGTALWFRWGAAGTELAVLADCPVPDAQGPGREGCCLFAGHAGQHTWEEAHLVEDPCTS
ncbi:hypothetical protein [Streptomyces sp. NPDC058773]|uniref:hypothetical protein n=1 Tax=Streptomyces sp. NPDC058773 TaxID=3346632 RepID=UPI0036B99054